MRRKVFTVMKKIYPILIVLILFSCTELVISIDEPIKRIPERPESRSPVPSGSYQDRCRNCNANDGILTCECRDNYGEWNVTRLSYQDCRGDIWNDNGLLRCEKNIVIDKTPPGSYREKCRNCSIEDGILECECREKDGGWRRTRLKYWKCDGDIWNNDGMLGCDQQSKKDKKPRGSYEKTCRECTYLYGVLECECRKKSGEWQSTQINRYQCTGPIMNDDGVLRCN